jgi:hypothetical protein
VTHAPAPDPDVISKSEFARRRNVAPSRVTQWIEAGKISGAAMVGQGRNAQLRESVACQQLNRTLDISQRLGNGLATRLTSTPPAQQPIDFDAGRAAGGDAPAATTQDRIAIERLEQARRQNERDRRDDAVACGLLVDAKTVRLTAGRQAFEMLTRFDGALNDLATAVSAEFKMPQRDVLHLLRKQYREVRASMAAEMKSRAAVLPDRVDFDVDPASPPTSPIDEDGRAP